MTEDLRQYVTTIGAITEVITLAQAKEWCRVPTADTSQDSTINLLIAAMREYAEELTGRSFAQRTLELRMDAFPADGGVIELPYPPLRSVTSVTYIDSEGVTQTLDYSPTGWQEDNIAEPGRILPLTTVGSWPDTASEAGAVRIRYIAGYPDGMTPNKSLLWMRARLSTFYENREQVVPGSITILPHPFVDGLLDSLITWRRFA